MAKKKKTQLKPVARGFATISVPKKVIHIEEVAVDDVKTNSADEGPVAKVDVEQEGDASSKAPAQSDEFDPDKVEEQSLQNLVDKLQEKTEKEITRCVSRRYCRLKSINQSCSKNRQSMYSRQHGRVKLM
jgi:ATP-dependent RNA helicase DHX29